MLSLQPHMRIPDSFLFLAKAGKLAITMKKKAKIKGGSRKKAKIQGKEHGVANGYVVNFVYYFSDKTLVSKPHGPGVTYCLVIS